MGAPNARNALWRFIVTNLDSETLTWLDRLAMSREVVVTRGAPRQFSASVPSDNPEVNIPTPLPDGDAFVSEGTRFIFGFRREERPTPSDPPWKCRFSGLVLECNDIGESDQARTEVVAYDPWKYLYRRPVLLPSGDLPGSRGVDYVAGVRPDEIVIGQLLFAETYGSPTFIDWGQTAFYTGTIETIADLEDGGDGLGISFPPGTSLGEMLDELQALGTCDIVMEPIYDPINRPGFLVQLSILERKGEYRPEAMIGWDQWPRNVVGISRQLDGTERGNRMKFYASNNLPVLLDISDASSYTKYGDYWSMQSFPGRPSLKNAEILGEKQLDLIANGLVTYQIALSPERAPMLFLEYEEGDTVPVYASKRLRYAIPGEQVRIEGIPIQVGEDDVERVDNLLVSLEPVPST